MHFKETDRDSVADEKDFEKTIGHKNDVWVK